MDNNQKAVEKLLSLKRTLKYNEKQLLQDGEVHPVIDSVRKRNKRFYRFVLTLCSFMIVLGVVRLFIDPSGSFWYSIIPIGFSIFLTSFVHKNHKHIEEILNESESFLIQ